MIEDVALGLCVEGGSGFIEYKQLRTAYVCTRKGNALPLASGQFDAAVETPSKHLIEAERQSRNDLVRATPLRGTIEHLTLAGLLARGDGDVFRRCHFVSY